MKSQSQSQSPGKSQAGGSIVKFFHAELHLLNLLGCVLCFGIGLALGHTVSSLKAFPFSLRVTHLSSSLSSHQPPTPSSPPRPHLPSAKLQAGGGLNLTTFKAAGEGNATAFARGPPPPTNPASSHDASTLVTACQQPQQNTSSGVLVGLRKLIEPPPAMHAMDDRQLLWRAAVTPLIPEFPYDRVPKVAFMFLVKGDLPMAPLWEKFFKGHEGLYSIYVHPNPSYGGAEPPPGSVFHGRRIPSQEVRWGEVNMIEAERRLLANALLDMSNERFVLLSESCIPLFNFSTVYSYLVNSTLNYVESYDLPGPVGQGRYNHRMAPTVVMEQWRKGSQWVEMGRGLAVAVVSDRKYFPVFQQHCHHQCYSDEHYLPTLVNVEHGKGNANRTLTYVNWEKGGPHPTTFHRTRVTVDFLESLRNRRDCEYNGQKNGLCYLFARKFTDDALYRLMTFAPGLMQFNP